MRYLTIIGGLLLWLPILLFPQTGWGQKISGKVYEESANHERSPLVGVNVHWLGTQSGTSTDHSGSFEIKPYPGVGRLVFSYIGYTNDTLLVGDRRQLEVELKSDLTLDEVTVVERRRSTEISMISSRKVEHIGEKELLKAACCNLSESFETSPSIDVSFTDAVTGTRQIQMLGLAGPYVQLTNENMPGLRGLASIYGLTYIPGTWIESIQLNKGAGSVANGFESIVGQINVEQRKPAMADPLYLNFYANSESRLEANLNLTHRFKNSHWSTALLLHAKGNPMKLDNNHDGFMDMPTGNTWIGLNRWMYLAPGGFEMQFGVKLTDVDNHGGQTDFVPGERQTFTSWGMANQQHRVEAWSKIGKVFAAKPWKSFGFQLSGVGHRQNSFFGLNDYDARQFSFYANGIYQSIIGNDKHAFKTGGSLQFDRNREHFNQTDFRFNEAIPGVFFEYSWTPSDKFGWVAGIRADHHNQFGWFASPRFHLRYAPLENTVFRFSAGRGQRTASMISENSGLLASSRQFVFTPEVPGKGYGFRPEVAWNFGFNLTQKFTIDYRQGSISADFYRTSFAKQVVVDTDADPQQVQFYALEGQAYSNSFQVQIDYELLNRFDVRLAYRLYDVKTDYRSGRLSKPLLASNRAFVNLAWETRSHWRFDYTWNWQGSKRIPGTGTNPEPYRMSDRSPSFGMMNAQVSKNWKECFEVYLGAENLTGYKQKNPILAANDPFGPYFDSSMIWGPIWGRTLYIGLRYKLF